MTDCTHGNAWECDCDEEKPPAKQGKPERDEKHMTWLHGGGTKDAKGNGK